MVQLAHDGARGRAPGGAVVRRAGAEQGRQAGDVHHTGQLGAAVFSSRNEQRTRRQAGGDCVLVQRAPEQGLDLDDATGM